MYRIIIDKIFYNPNEEYIQWVEDKEHLKELGYRLRETSVLFMAEKEYSMPFNLDRLGGKEE